MKELDNTLVELLNAIFDPILDGIAERAKEIEKTKEEEDAQNIGKKECCGQEEG